MKTKSMLNRKSKKGNMFDTILSQYSNSAFKLALIAVLGLLIFISSASSQQPNFKVLAIKGEIKFSSGDRGNWETLTIKSPLFEKDRIKLGENNYLGLVHSSGKTTELKKSGTYKIADLNKSLSKKDISISKKLTSYLINEIGSSEDIMKGDSYQKHMSTTGAVERGLDMGSNAENTEGFFSEVSLKIVSPRKSNIRPGEIILKWQPLKDAKNYKFTLFDRFDREILSKVIEDTSAKLNTNELNLDKDVYYFWSISLPENPTVKSDDCAFAILEDGKLEQIEKDFQALKSETGAEPSPLNNIIYAAFFEERGLYFEALEYYEGAILNDPEVPEFKKLLTIFRHKLESIY